MNIFFIKIKGMDGERKLEPCPNILRTEVGNQCLFLNSQKSNFVTKKSLGLTTLKRKKFIKDVTDQNGK